MNNLKNLVTHNEFEAHLFQEKSQPLTNCYNTHISQSQFKFLPKLPSPFEIKLTDPTVKLWLNPIYIRRPLV